MLDVVRERTLRHEVAEDAEPERAGDGVRHAERFAFLCEELGQDHEKIEAFTEWLWLEIANLRVAYRLAIAEGLTAQICAFATHLSAPFFEAGAWDDFGRLSAAGHQAARESGADSLVIRLLGLEGALAGRRGRNEECVELWRRRLEYSRRSGDLAGEADSLIDLATVAFQAKKLEEAESLVAEALLPSQLAERYDLVATVHIVRGLVCIDRGETEQAVAWAREAETASHGATGSPLMFVFTNLGRVFLASGEVNDAEAAYGGALRLASSGRRQFHILGALVGLAKTRLAIGDRESAAKCLIAAKKLGLHTPSKRAAEADELLQTLREELIGTAEGAVFAELAPQPWTQVVSDIIVRMDDWKQLPHKAPFK